MKITNEIKKQKAIELMNKLNIYEPYIRGFENDNMVCFFENFGGFWAYQEPELMAKIKEIEKNHNDLVLAHKIAKEVKNNYIYSLKRRSETTNQ